MSYFDDLNAVNVNEHTEKKNGLTYLSWAWAWGELKKRHPLSFYTVYENKDGWNYFTDGKTAWVKTGVTVVDELANLKIEHVEMLPVMDTRNRSIPVEQVTSFDVNKAIQRSLTKACARHGLGLYIYAGEDLPEDAGVQSDQYKEGQPYPTVTCENCGEQVKPVRVDGKIKSVQDQVDGTKKTFGKTLCRKCAIEEWTGGHDRPV